MSSRVDIKCVMVGASFVGKTALMQRFLHDKWAGERHVPTIGASFGARDLVADGRAVTLGCWDTAGSERYESMTKMYYRGARGAIVCYDITDAASFEKAKYWVSELRSAEEDVVVALVATKTDLLGAGGARGVPVATVLKYARSIDAEHFETSSKTGRGCDAPFLGVVARCAKQVQQVQEYDPGFRLGRNSPRGRRRGGGGGAQEKRGCPCK